MSDQKQLFNHYYFNTFKKGTRVYMTAPKYDWTKSTWITEAREGAILCKKAFSVTIRWKNISRLDTMPFKEAVEKLSLCYEPNDILKDIL